MKILQFYIDGFRNMKVGKSLWVIIGIKFVIFFIIMKTLFFPNFLKENFSNDTQRADFVLQTLTNKD
jgi:flagellar basal body-associated protein FliL